MPNKVPDPDNASRPVTDPHEDSTEGLNAGLRPSKGSTDPKFGPSSKTYGKQTGNEVRQAVEKLPTETTPQFPVVEWDDPCARYKALADAYFLAVKGEREVSIRTRTMDAEEEVKFGKGDILLLRNEMDKAKAQCEALCGLSTLPNRFAIGLVNKPRCCGPRRV